MNWFYVILVYCTIGISFFGLCYLLAWLNVKSDERAHREINTAFGHMDGYICNGLCTKCESARVVRYLESKERIVPEKGIPLGRGLSFGPGPDPMRGHQKGVIYDCICGQCQEHNERLMTRPSDYDRYRKQWEENNDFEALYLMTKAMENGEG